MKSSQGPQSEIHGSSINVIQVSNWRHKATRLDKDERGSSVNETMYRGIIGSLMYLTASRPDIVFSVGLCARFQSNPKESHRKAAKRILRYLKGTQDLVDTHDDYRAKSSQCIARWSKDEAYICKICQGTWFP
ncbi:uncharacterized protein LOC142177134 [Nicotiana tabacum]|uniref:Uncharacterized protein LOC142177134 n=1 Tax=Nicotiana tabacum TaxID=4097 RepID=A0AC58TWU3_TOBAC